jgi:hypothetical protein
LFAVCDPPLHRLPRYPAILLPNSLLILGGAFSTHRLVKGDEKREKVKARATVERIQHRVKVKSDNENVGLE